MAGAHGIQSIEKLTEDNYESWKIQMKNVLVYNDLWGYVNGAVIKTADNTAAWTEKDQKTLELIVLSVSRGQLNHVKRAETSNAAWDDLKRVHESTGPVRKATLYKQLYRMKKESGITMNAYINDFTNKAEQLTEAGIKIPDDLLSIMLLSSLPNDFENFSIAIESRDEIPNIDSLKVKLLEEEARQNKRMGRNDSENGQKNDALLSHTHARDKQKRVNSTDKFAKQNQRKFTVKCFNCSKLGHKSADCRLKTKRGESNSKSDAMTAIVCNTEVSKSNEWFLDSGATRHMCNDNRKFTMLNDTERSKVFTAAEHCLDSSSTGEINLRVNNRGSKNNVKLEDTMFVPALRNNLMSVSTITDKGYTVVFDKKRATIKRKDGSTALTATKKNQLYVVNETNDHAMAAGDVNDDKMTRWHQRYGHLNIADLKNLKIKEMVKGVEFTTKTNEFRCDICDKSKIHIQPFKPSKNRETEVLNLVHSDICGPMNVESLAGSKYFVTFIDDFSRYTEVVMLRQRSDVLKAFRNYKRRVEKLTGRHIKKLRTDNGKEYLSNEFKKFFEDEGISRQLSVEYTPQQNGVAERANRTIIEMARCMLQQSGLPQSLWAEAVNTATFIRNRCPTKCLNDKTPIEAWTNKKPYVGFFRIFGSKVIALNKGPKRGKFLQKGEEYALVGYSDEAKAYRLWKPGTKTVIKSRDVKFHEKIHLIGNDWIKFPNNLNNDVSKKETLSIDTMPTNPKESEVNEEMANEYNQQLEDNDSEDEDDEITEKNEENRGNESRRGRGRPKLLKTGQRGRPKKIYQRTDVNNDPVNVAEVMNQSDRSA
ncbi:retrovirus-related pol polyprotein from transposon tnt 1-94 [Lasius niger]|uniref:Retrovirus-related pol polyprotein from transposon tnt 1-94 n=1 Tax=Lasius niger TaxID=67767 RepID=A0A0J7K4R5_LASNI|nr:retrovirus-related pol polyprotein from transposon tnt 1-94 [Lasius niger]